MIANQQSGTNVHEIAAGIYRINTPVELRRLVQRLVSRAQSGEHGSFGR